jgi:hypothetical protein
MNGDFPPSSNVTALRLLFAANWYIIFPVSVDPVNAICKFNINDTFLINVGSTFSLTLYIEYQNHCNDMK